MWPLIEDKARKPLVLWEAPPQPSPQIGIPQVLSMERKPQERREPSSTRGIRLFFLMFSYSPGWPQTNCVAEPNLEYPASTSQTMELQEWASALVVYGPRDLIHRFALFTPVSASATPDFSHGFLGPNHRHLLFEPVFSFLFIFFKIYLFLVRHGGHLSTWEFEASLA